MIVKKSKDRLVLSTVEQGSAEWHDLRSGLVTASQMPKLVTPGGKPSKQMDKVAREMAACKFAGHGLERWEGNAWTDRGQLMERLARSWFEMETGFSVSTEWGFIHNTEIDAGFSPDGVIPEQNALLEIKCFSHGEHVSAIANNEPLDAQLPQIQSCLAFADFEKLYLIYFHPHLPKVTFIVNPDAAWRENILAAVKECNSLRDYYLAIMKDLVE